jgi:hypothetical protein
VQDAGVVCALMLPWCRFLLENDDVARKAG